MSHGPCCTDVAEGRRRRVEFDCSALGLECRQGLGGVSCGDVPVIEPPTTPPPPRGPAPDYAQMVNQLFRGDLKNR